MRPRSFKTALRCLREARGLSQLALAKRARISQQYLNELETGKKANPGIQVLRKLAKALEVEPHELF